jgi:hypothetical protein
MELDNMDEELRAITGNLYFLIRMNAKTAIAI